MAEKKSVVTELMEEGKRKGKLTAKEITDALEEMDFDAEQLDKFYDSLESSNIEKQIAEYDAKFAAATDYNEADYTAYNDLKTRYDHQMHEWEKASYELEITEEQYNG